MTPDAAAQPIVVHSPVTGDPARIAELPAEQRDPRAPAVRTRTEIPPEIRDPGVEQQARAAAAAQSRVRASGLDAVRGLCLLGMNFTFALPHIMLLPAWMYHTQNPPPGTYVAQPGLTWQDIIFPGFLFAMAAAIPIRNSQLLAAGESAARIAWGSIQRAALLYLFALVIGHVNPFYSNNYTRSGNLLAIAGFLACFAIFIRPKPSWNPAMMRWMRRAGWLAAGIILFVMPATWGASFSITRRDTIITSIAFCYVLGSLLWLVTRERPATRVFVTFVLGVLKLLAPLIGFIGAFWARSSAPWLYEPWFFELLLIAIPGTLAGDMLLSWTRLDATEREGARAGTRARLTGIAALGLLAPIVLVIGLYERWLIQTTLATFAMVVAGALLLSGAQSPRDALLKRMAGWTGALLVLGVLLEPLEGGIKKSPQTLSFLVLCAGIWYGVLLAATIIIDVFAGRARKAAQPLVLVGQNAMLAYVIYMLFLNHLAYYVGVGDFLSATPGQQVARALLLTTLVMSLLYFLTKKRIVWRS